IGIKCEDCERSVMIGGEVFNKKMKKVVECDEEKES
ncbi:DUF951 family protein, partial [Staphylococcus epidermidis]